MWLIKKKSVLKNTLCAFACLTVLVDLGTTPTARAEVEEDISHFALALCDGPPKIVSMAATRNSVERFDYKERRTRRAKTDWIETNCAFLLYANKGQMSALENIKGKGLLFGFVDHYLIAENAGFAQARKEANPIGAAVLENTVLFSDEDFSLSAEIDEIREWTGTSTSDFSWRLDLKDFTSGKLEKFFADQISEPFTSGYIELAKVLHGPEAAKNIVLLKLASKWSE